MAKYNYKCSKCDSTELYVLSVANFLAFKSNNYFDNKKCENCGNITEFIRIFDATSSKISKGKEQILAEVKEDARKIVEKVKSGNTKAILDIYGDII